MKQDNRLKEHPVTGLHDLTHGKVTIPHPAVVSHVLKGTGELMSP